jgi:hypothetical protein
MCLHQNLFFAFICLKCNFAHKPFFSMPGSQSCAIIGPLYAKKQNMFRPPEELQGYAEKQQWSYL